MSAWHRLIYQWWEWRILSDPLEHQNSQYNGKSTCYFYNVHTALLGLTATFPYGHSDKNLTNFRNILGITDSLQSTTHKLHTFKCICASCSQTLELIVCKLDANCIFIPHFSKIHFNMNFPSTPLSPKLSGTLRLFDQKSIVCTYLPMLTAYSVSFALP
jgi:hypothetical protein